MDLLAPEGSGLNTSRSNDSPMHDPYGAVVERFADHIEVEYNGLEFDDLITRATANLGRGYGGILCGRIDPTKTHVAPHKTPWHAGYTGYSGRDAESDEMPRLFRNVVRRIALGRERGVVNLGARMPLGVIGCDVDAYGDKHGLTTLARHEERLGPLPPTYVVTARQYETGSGIRLYSVPHDWAGVGELEGAHVELIQRHHRFIVAPGGLHHSCGVYKLYDGRDGSELDGVGLPMRGDLPELPEEWLEALYRKASRTRSKGTQATSSEIDHFAETYTFDENPDLLAITVEQVRSATGDGWTRNAYHRALFIAARRARVGCYPWATAVEAIYAAAIDAYRARDRTMEVHDFSRSVRHAVGMALDMSVAELAAWADRQEPMRRRRFAYRRQQGGFVYRRAR